MPDIDDVCGSLLTSGTIGSSLGGGSLSSSANGADLVGSKHQENQTNMLLHNISKIERLTERENSSNAISRTSRFIPQLRKRSGQSNKRSSETYSGDSALVSNKFLNPCNNKNKAFTEKLVINSCTNHVTTISTNSTNNTHKYSLITLSTPLTALTKYTLKNICKSTPNISITNQSNFNNNITNTHNKRNKLINRRSYVTNENQTYTKPASSVSINQSVSPPILPTPLLSSSKSTNRKGFTGLAGIHDIGVTLRLHLQSLDYLKSSGSGGTTALSSSGSGSGSSTTVSSHLLSKSNHKKERTSFLGQTIHRTHQRKSSLDEKDSGSGGSGGSGVSSINVKDQRNSVDVCSILLTDDESGNSRISDTGIIYFY